MATFLDISGLNFFSSVFTYILVFVVVYALLTWGKVLGSNKGIHALMSAAIAILFMFSKDAIEVINFVVPWFTMMFIVILLMLMAYSLFNPGGDIFGLLVGSGKHRVVIYWVIILSVVVILIGLGRTYGERVGPYLDEEGNPIDSDGNIISGSGDNFRGDGFTNTADWETNVGATIFHPKMLSIIFILLLGTFTILQIAR
ncbi:hypothetical protein GOV08_00065 [Candidatus Woesearchaeota archaeon]|nr:hypothetical protein [Candidatus Woesearchaeota archaeon]